MQLKESSSGHQEQDEGAILTEKSLRGQTAWQQGHMWARATVGLRGRPGTHPRFPSSASVIPVFLNGHFP